VRSVPAKYALEVNSYIHLQGSREKKTETAKTKKPRIQQGFSFSTAYHWVQPLIMAERVGFEPTKGY